MSEPGIAYRPNSLSPSSASTFRDCARRWKFRYIDKLPDPPSEAMLLGQFVHKVLEDLLQLPPEDRTLEKARRISTGNWPDTEASLDYQSLELDEEQQKAFKRKIWGRIEGYFQMFDPTTTAVVGRELKVDAEIEGVPFVGYVDLLEDVPAGAGGAASTKRVTDFKTGRPPSPRFVDDALSQIWLYAAALETMGTAVGSVQLAYLGDGKPGAAIVREMNEDAMGVAVSRHSQTWVDIHAALANSDFPPRPGGLCGWCPYRSDCPEGQAEYDRRNPPLLSPPELRDPQQSKDGKKEQKAS